MVMIRAEDFRVGVFFSCHPSPFFVYLTHPQTRIHPPGWPCLPHPWLESLKFGPAEYFSLMVSGLVGAVVLAHGSLLKTIAMVLLSLLLGLAGTDVSSAAMAPAIRSRRREEVFVED